MEKKKPLEALEESMKPDPEKESPRRSWFYIFLAVVLIFGITFVFQQLNEPVQPDVDPYSFDQVKDEVTNLRRELDILKEDNAALESRVEELEEMLEQQN